MINVVEHQSTSEYKYTAV